MQRTAVAPAAVLGRREQRKHVTRRDLLAAGRRLFSEKGLYESRIEDLTRTAGIAKGTIYGYFKNKEALIQAVIADGFGELQAKVRAECEGSANAADLYARMVGAHVDYFCGSPEMMRVFHQMRGLLKFGRPEWRPLRNLLRGHIEFLAEQMAAVPGNPQATATRRLESARLLFGTVSGFMSVSAAADSGARVAPPPDTVRRSIVAMLAAHGAPATRARR
jgi:AcrR family transcriptional regulator